jgi:phosphonate transport system substrate-binding protein
MKTYKKTEHFIILNTQLPKIRFILVVIIIIIYGFIQPVVLNGQDKGALKKVVRFSAITLYHPIVMYKRYQPLMSYLTQNTPYRFELKLSQDYRDIINFIKNGEVEVALLGGVTYSLAKKEFDVIPILAPLSVDGKPFYKCAFIVRDSNYEINKLSDLKGKSLALASELSTSGNLVPLFHLYAKGIQLGDLKKITHFRYHDSVAREVLRGNFDAGAVISSVANRFKDRGLKIIDLSDPIPALPIVVRGDVPAELIMSLKKALLSLNYNTPEHRKIMEQWDEEFRYGFAEINDSDYDSIHEMINHLASKGVSTP